MFRAKNLKLHAMLSIAVILATCLIAGCEKIPTQVMPPTPEGKTAVATITEKPGTDSGITGTAVFMESEGKVHVRIEIQGAAPGPHAAHLHNGTDCANAEGHWHPTHIPIGTIGVPIVEATAEMPPVGRGEIGNIQVGEDGTGTLEFTTSFWSLGGDSGTDILGKLLMIHEKGDTFETPPAVDADIAPPVEQPPLIVIPEPGEPIERVKVPEPVLVTKMADPADDPALAPIVVGGGARLACGVIALTE